MNYKFYVTTTMKEYNQNKYWICSDIIAPIVIEAMNLKEALSQFAKVVYEKYYIEISKNALKTKSNMYIDDKAGNATQTGYVITGKTDFQDDKTGHWTSQYIDLWTTIKEERSIEF